MADIAIGKQIFGSGRSESGPRAGLMTTSYSKTGYTNEDVKKLKTKGDLLSEDNSAEVKMIGQQTRTTTANVPITTGHLNDNVFGNTFSDMSTDQLQGLVNIFEARRQGVLQRTRQPGRSVLMAEG